MPDQAMASSNDLEQQTHERHDHHGGSTRTDEDEGHAATCSPCPIRGVITSAILDPEHVCCSNNLVGSLTPSWFSRCLPRPPAPPPPPARVYHVWPGKNVFFLDGRVVCGPNPRGLILSSMAILLSEWVFLAFVVDGSSTAYQALISACSLILAATVIATLLLTATRDPGIIPRRSQVPPSEEEAGTTTPTGGARSSTPSRFTVVNGVETRLGFCRTCRIFRPPRSSHCAVCDNCVDRFDHHSTWISQCVGLRNFRLYLVLVCSALAFYAFMFPFTVRRIIIRATRLDSSTREEEKEKEGRFSGLIHLPETHALAVLCFSAVCFFGYLLAFNAFLVAKNKTRRERDKQQRRHLGGWSSAWSSPNPYDLGTTLGNVRECLFVKLPPPRVDFRAVVTEPNDQLVGAGPKGWPETLSCLFKEENNR